ncbi:hypothetical protein [Sphingomonas sp.]|uniref:hypothetical protein n=1 Tax=Sphingomonas sp. TaxID=28214 RepID=UPI00286E58FF|nr:hypothetical protein [Sphingomonas sp.]
MRPIMILAPLVLIASPAVAQSAPAPAPAAPIEDIRVPPELTDPRFTARIGDVMQALSKAFLNLPVGEIEAAVEGRRPTAVDRRRTIRDVGRRDDPHFERNLEAQIAGSQVAMQAGARAMATALPAMMKGLSEAAREIEKATANLPSPVYPKR